MQERRNTTADAKNAFSKNNISLFIHLGNAKTSCFSFENEVHLGNVYLHTGDNDISQTMDRWVEGWDYGTTRRWIDEDQ